MTKRPAVFLCLFLLFPFSAQAHQPRLVSSDDAEKGIDVSDPVISKAYYCELKGKPHVYTISSREAFAAYAGILVPGAKLSRPVSFDVLSGATVIFRGDGASFEWRPFYEKHGGDWYMSGPEYGAGFRSTHVLPAGVYTVRVYSADNRGKYSLAVGDVEHFPFIEIVKAAWNVILLKLFFF